jgi:Bacteriophage probable baseplate hub protein
MAVAVPIATGQDFYVPAFELKLRGRAAGEDVLHDVSDVTYRDNVEEFDVFELTLNNWDAERLAFKYLDDQTFDPGTEVELRMGYYGPEPLTLMVTGVITSVSPSFPSSGQPTLTVEGANLLHTFRRGQESATYEKTTDSEVARAVAQRLGTTARTDSAAEAQEERIEYLIQDNELDVLFLFKRARRIGYDLLVEESAGQPALYFGPSDVRRASYRLVYGESLIEFAPDLSTTNQVAEVTVQGWDAKRKKEIAYTAKRSELKTRGVGERGGQGRLDRAFRDRKEVIAESPVQTPKEAKTLAVETLERIAKDMLTGTGSTVGVPDLRAGSVLELAGLGDRYSGRYFVTATTHTIGDGGYTTQFTCRREEI